MKTSRMIKEIAACDGKARNEMEWQRPEARETTPLSNVLFWYWTIGGETNPIGIFFYTKYNPSSWTNKIPPQNKL